MGNTINTSTTVPTVIPLSVTSGNTGAVSGSTQETNNVVFGISPASSNFSLFIPKEYSLSDLGLPSPNNSADVSVSALEAFLTLQILFNDAEKYGQATLSEKARSNLQKTQDLLQKEQDARTAVQGLKDANISYTKQISDKETVIKSINEDITTLKIQRDGNPEIVAADQKVLNDLLAIPVSERSSTWQSDVDAAKNTLWHDMGVSGDILIAQKAVDDLNAIPPDQRPSTWQDDLKAAQDTLDQAKSDYQDLSTQITAKEAQITDLQKDISVLQGRIDKNTQDIKEKSGELDAVDTQIVSLAIELASELKKIVAIDPSWLLKDDLIEDQFGAFLDNSKTGASLKTSTEQGSTGSSTPDGDNLSFRQSTLSFIQNFLAQEGQPIDPQERSVKIALGILIALPIVLSTLYDASKSPVVGDDENPDVQGGRVKLTV